jgi:AmiR/NasT family two-component response regulator
VKRLRVLVANRPRLMRELVLAVIADQPDIEIIGEVQNENELPEAVDDAKPDILILSLEDAEKQVAQCGFLLGRYPHMRILALAPEKNRGLLYWAVADVRTKPMVSSEAGILSALRDRPSVVGTSQN